MRATGSDVPYLDWPGPIPFAHRGGNTEHPENTLAAFRHAVDLGYRYLETDVHLSADGVLVAFHDDDLRRTCGVDARIADLAWAEIEPLRVDGSEAIPTMRELLETFRGERFNIDAKSDATVEPLGDLIAEFDAVERVCLASFEPGRLRRFRRRFGTRLVTNLARSEVISLKLLGAVRASTPVAAQVPMRVAVADIVTPRFLRRAQAREIPVHVWTLNEPDEMHRVLDVGVDGIMTDRPETLRGVLIERDAWFS